MQKQQLTLKSFKIRLCF